MVENSNKELYNIIIDFLKGVVIVKKIISLFLVAVLILATLVGCGSSKLKDGTFEGEGEGMHGPLKVSVEIKEGKIADVEITEHEENMDHAKPAITDLPGAIVDKNSADVDAVTGATSTSNAIKEAVKDALSKAK